MRRHSAKSAGLNALPKAPTGITGFDQITEGGLPRARPTLICGGPGCGKTLFGLEFVIRGALDFDEPGVIITFEENVEDLERNVASMGLDLGTLVARKKIAIDYVRVERAEIEETGEYNLEGLFVRIKYAVDQVGAKRVMLDTVETLFAGLTDQGVLRSELRRLFRWFKEQGLTTVITGEAGEKTLTRHGLEEYVSDCVIMLDQRVRDQITTRRLRIVKYRGTTHGANEYPFVIDSEGISVFPITALNLDFKVSTRRISSGIPALNEMLGGGYYEGSTILLTGSAGTGKTSLASSLAESVCLRGQRCLYFSFEEAPQQLFRNMKSIGINLQPHVDSGRLRVESARPTLLGLEQHIVRLRKLIEIFRPEAVILDPISSLLGMGEKNEIDIAVTRIIDFLKGKGVTAFVSSLTQQGSGLETSTIGLSSLIDTWLLLRDFETANERNRGLFIVKSRGMAHSNQVREFKLTDNGVVLQAPYLGAAGILMGSSRLAQEMQDAAEKRVRSVEADRRKDLIETKRLALESEIDSLRLAFKAEAGTIEVQMAEETQRESASTAERGAIAKSRWTQRRIGAEGPHRGVETVVPRSGGFSPRTRARRRRPASR
jgi:circadian clock protein KaiC